MSSDRIGGPVHHPDVHARQILTDDAEREELRARENGDDRREKREPLYDRTVEEEATDDEHEHADPEDREGKPDPARHLEGQRGKPRDQIQGMGEEHAK
jgi:hypothetical protein